MLFFCQASVELQLKQTQERTKSLEAELRALQGKQVTEIDAKCREIDRMKERLEGEVRGMEGEKGRLEASLRRAEGDRDKMAAQLERVRGELKEMRWVRACWFLRLGRPWTESFSLSAQGDRESVTGGEDGPSGRYR